MFKFLKDKLKGAVKKFSKDVEEEAEDVLVEAPAEEKKGFFTRIKEKITKEKTEDIVEKKPEKEEEKPAEVVVEEKKEKTERARAEAKEIPKKDAEKKIVEREIPKTKGLEPEKEVKEEHKEKKGLFEAIKEKVTKKVISEERFEALFWELEVVLLENNVAFEVIEKIKEDLKKDLVDNPITRTKINETIEDSLRNSIKGLFETGQIDLIQKIKTKKEKPFVIVCVGVNGSGKTTTIAKLVKLFQDNKLKSVIAASDTFRAAAIEQLQKHADKLGVKLIKHQYGADPAAVAYDAIAHAKSKAIDVVLIDTAGRLHSNENLMEELKKVARVAKPDFTIFIGEAITGNDCIEQAKQFDTAANIDGIVLSKADVDEKGGAAISVSYVTGKPILYLGVGQGYKDLEQFDPEKIIKSVGL